MKITFINNDGAGYADHKMIPHGTTVAELFEREMPHGKPTDYLIRVNRQPAIANYVRTPGKTAFEPLALDVLRIEGGEIAEIVTFDGSVFPAFRLPASL